MAPRFARRPGDKANSAGAAGRMAWQLEDRRRLPYAAGGRCRINIAAWSELASDSGLYPGHCKTPFGFCAWRQQQQVAQHYEQVAVEQTSRMTNLYSLFFFSALFVRLPCCQLPSYISGYELSTGPAVVRFCQANQPVRQRGNESSDAALPCPSGTAKGTALPQTVIICHPL